MKTNNLRLDDALNDNQFIITTQRRMLAFKKSAKLANVRYSCVNTIWHAATAKYAYTGDFVITLL